MRAKVKLDWDTVELVDAAGPVREPAAALVWQDRRGRSTVKKILSGAAAKARARGARYTHTQLRRFLPAGVETLIYGWWLVVAAMQRDVSAGVEIAASAIWETSLRVQAHVAEPGIARRGIA